MGASVNLSIVVTAAVAGDLTVELALPAPWGTLVFDQAKAIDIGDYIGPFVQQKRLMQRQGPWTVLFSPDVAAPRQEVTVEYGTQYNFSALPAVTADGSVPAQLLTPYIATISNGGVVLATVNVPIHWWMARWRWRSAPRPVVRTLADLVAMKALPPMDAKLAWNTGPLPAVSWSGPMGTADLTTGMGSTGDREEIGMITEAQAGYLLTGNAGSLTRLLSQAEAAGSVPYWVRDAATNALMDIKNHPYISYKGGAGAQYDFLQAPSPDRTTYPNYFLKDAAHLPALSFVAWLLTDDPWFLEGAQAETTYSMMYSSYWSYILKLPGMVDISQHRAVAWGLRDQLRMVGFAPASPPSWLLPRSYFAACAADTLTWLESQVNISPTVDPTTATFHFVPYKSTVAVLEISYQLLVAGWALWSGLFPAWTPAIEWLAYSIISMTAADSPPGWDRRYPVPYNIIFPSPFPANYNWLDLWTAYAAAPNGDQAPFNPAPSAWPAGVLSPQTQAGNVQLDYCNYNRAALSVLALAGVAGAQAANDWLEPQLAVDIPKNQFSSHYKWAF